MKKASELIEQLETGAYDQRLGEVYVEVSHTAVQRQRYCEALEKFISTYGDHEVEIFSTPGRSEVCGNHTDHQQGEVLAGAINLDIIAIVAPHHGEVKVLSDQYDLKAIDIAQLDVVSEEAETSESLIRGVLARFNQLGYQIGGFQAYLTSDVLQGSGLSSSAAFEVMIGTILSGLYNDMKVDPVTIAQVGQYAENVYFGKPCGLMDQCACSVGGLIHIDFQDPDNPQVNQVDLEFEKFQHSLAIVDVHASHADLTADYAAIPAEMREVARHFCCAVLREVDEAKFYREVKAVREVAGDRAVLRAIHFFNENRRVEQAVACLGNDDFEGFKDVILKSGASSFQYLQNVYSNTNPANQAVAVALALSDHILGDRGVSRVHGGGFAGTIQAFVKDGEVADYKRQIEETFGAGSCHVLKIRKYGGIKII